MFQILCIIVTVQMVKNYKAMLSGANKYWKNCCDDTGMAERSYPASEASGGREETPRIRDQGRPREATSCLRPGAVTLRSHPEPEPRASSWEE